ncbi:hypothetical protein K4K59_001396 [Colletotrichum sp. SAR11_240]|nr:hypothetical protein K4K59_001396 [Colletotrichum sp. SAR11_240]
MSATSAQDPPRCKKGWLKWAKAQMHPKYAEVHDLDFQLRRIINTISWDKIRKRVLVTQEPSYKRLLTFLGNAQNHRLRPPSPVDCEAVRIMNGGEFPEIISSFLRNAGWEPSACTDPLLIAIERVLRPPPPPPPSPEKEKEDLAPKEPIPWMEWAKRHKNPAFDDAPQRAELEDNLEAVRWNVKTPKCYKLQQPFIFLMGRWGPDGERGPDDVPSAVNLEATRIMNNGKLPQELCEWLANAGWDAEKCCNPKLSIAEKKLSADPPTTTHQQEPATPIPVDRDQEATNNPPETPEDDEEITPPSPEIVEKVERPQTPAPPQLSSFASSSNHQFDPDDCPRLEMLWRSTPAPRTEDMQGEMPPPKMQASKRNSADDHGESAQQPKRQRTSMFPGDPLNVDMSAAVTVQVQLRDEEHHHHQNRLRRAFLAVEHASREVGRAGNAFDIARRDLDMALEQQNITIAALKTLLDADGAEMQPVHLDEPEVPTRERESCLPQLFGTLSNFSIFMVLHVAHTFILLGYFLTQGCLNFFKYLRKV